MKWLLYFLIPVSIGALEPNKSLKLAAYFAGQRNLFEAITEYKRYQFQQKKQSHLIEAKIGSLYERSDNFKKAQQHVELARNYAADPRLSFFYSLWLLDLKKEQGALVYRDIRLARLSFRTISSAESEQLRLAAAGFYVHIKRPENARQLLKTPMSEQKNELARSSAFAKLQSAPESYSNFNLLHAVFPGGAYLRFGEYKSFALSFSTVGILGGAAAAAFAASLPITGVVFAVLATRFYWVSFTQSLALIGKRNEQLQAKWRSDISGLLPDSFSGHIDYRLEF